MNNTLALTFGLVFVAVNAFQPFGAAPAVSARQTQSTWDGMYTKEQADRGSLLYARSCSVCHSQDLMGGETAPALTGGQFVSNWDTLSVGELFERVRISMPADNPGGLNRQEYADILAFLFSKNGFPAGAAELSNKTEWLNQIKFDARKPQ
jgi:mono/diheme cytochrome c family protein